jgi:hypothetical protein
MATNPKALELAKQGKVEYDWGTLWPHYHKEKMNWAGGFRLKGISADARLRATREAAMAAFARSWRRETWARTHKSRLFGNRWLPQMT